MRSVPGGGQSLPSRQQRTQPDRKGAPQHIQALVAVIALRVQRQHRPVKQPRLAQQLHKAAGHAGQAVIWKRGKQGYNPQVDMKVVLDIAGNLHKLPFELCRRARAISHKSGIAPG